MVFRQGLSRGDAADLWQVRDRTPDSRNWRHLKRQWRLLLVFEVASSTYINETRIQQPLVNPN